MDENKSSVGEVWRGAKKITEKVVIVGVALILATSVVGAGSHEWQYTGTSYNVETGTSPYGGVEHNGEIYITNQSHVIVYDTSYNRKRTHDISGTTTGARDLHWNGTHWLVLEDPGAVYVFNDSFAYSGQSYTLTYSDGSDMYRTRGMVELDGEYYITGYDFSGKRDIEKFDSSFNHIGALTNNITSETTGMQGVGYEGGSWFVLSGDDDAVYKYDSGGSFTGTSYNLSDAAGAKSGMLLQGNDWHVPSSNDDSIHVFSSAAGKYTLSGEVTDKDNNEIGGANITVKDGGGNVVVEDTTNQFGQYEVALENGTYNVTASKQDYSNQTKEVVIDGSDETVNFELTKFNSSIKLKTRSYIKHGQATPYSVVVTVNGDRKEVTGDSTVTSGNTSVVTIDSTAEEVVATSDIYVNDRTYVRAEWTDSDGNTYTAERNVTVANQTVENIGVLPTFPRMAASLEDQTIQVIIVATLVGAAATLVATSFAGISGITIIMLLGWVAGMTNNGMAIVTVLMAMFVGMNLAGNVDYTVRRG